MGVATHLRIRVDEYDHRIRTFIPWYEEILDAAAATVAAHLHGRSPLVVDLGIGSGALSSRCLACVGSARGVRIVGIDADEGMLPFAQARLGRRLTTAAGDFEKVVIPRSDAIVASFALHHVRTRKSRAALYRRCFAALSAHGVIVSADCSLASSRAQQHRDRVVWREHLERTYTAREAAGYLRAWAREDFYLELADEIELIRRAGFTVDVPWRRGSFAVIAGTR